MGKKILTLNIGAAGIVLAEYDVGAKVPRLLKYGTANLAADIDAGNADMILVPAIQGIMREKGMKPGKVAVSISGQMAFLRTVAIPMVGDSEKFASLVRGDIEQNIPFPIDEMVSGYQVLGDTENGDKSVLIVASKVEQVESITAAVKMAGLDPEIVSVAPVSVANLVKANPAYSDECVVVVDIGAKTTSLSIIEGEKLYNRAIPVAGRTITKEIAQNLGCTMEEAESYKLSNAYVSMGGVMEDEDETLDRVSKVCRSVMTRLQTEINRSINFYRSQQGGGTPAKIYLTGGTALLPQIGEFFQDALGVEVEFLNPLEIVSSSDPESVGADVVLLAATAGLALQAAGAAGISVNLIPPSIVEARKEAARIPFVVVGAVAFVAASAVWFAAQKSELAALTEESESLSQEARILTDNERFNTESVQLLNLEKEAAGKFAKRIERLDKYLARIEAVRKAIEPDMWIAKWEEKTIEVAVPQPQNSNRYRRNRGGEEEKKKVTVTEVVVRGWKDCTDALSKEHNGDTIQKIIRDRLKETGAFAEEGIETPEAPTRGRGGSLQEVVLKLQFKESEWK